MAVKNGDRNEHGGGSSVAKKRHQGKSKVTQQERGETEHVGLRAVVFSLSVVQYSCTLQASGVNISPGTVGGGKEAMCILYIVYITVKSNA